MSVSTDHNTGENDEDVTRDDDVTNDDDTKTQTRDYDDDDFTLDDDVTP